MNATLGMNTTIDTTVASLPYEMVSNLLTVIGIILTFAITAVIIGWLVIAIVYGWSLMEGNDVSEQVLPPIIVFLILAHLFLKIVGCDPEEKRGGTTPTYIIILYSFALIGVLLLAVVLLYLAGRQIALCLTSMRSGEYRWIPLAQAIRKADSLPVESTSPGRCQDVECGS